MSDIARGKEAQYLLNHPLLSEILDKIDAEAVKAIRDCAATDLLEYRARLDSTEWFRAALRSHLDSAIIAAKTEEMRND